VFEHPVPDLRDVMFPAAGAAGTLMDQLAEFKTKGNSFRPAQAASSNHCRAGW
jgi:hypothetical protein